MLYREKLKGCLGDFFPNRPYLVKMDFCVVDFVANLYRQNTVNIVLKFSNPELRNEMSK